MKEGSNGPPKGGAPTTGTMCYAEYGRRSLLSVIFRQHLNYRKYMGKLPTVVSYSPPCGDATRVVAVLVDDAAAGTKTPEQPSVISRRVRGA